MLTHMLTIVWKQNIDCDDLFALLLSLTFVTFWIHWPFLEMVLVSIDVNPVLYVLDLHMKYTYGPLHSYWWFRMPLDYELNLHVFPTLFFSSGDVDVCALPFRCQYTYRAATSGSNHSFQIIGINKSCPSIDVMGGKWVCVVMGENKLVYNRE